MCAPSRASLAFAVLSALSLAACAGSPPAASRPEPMNSRLPAGRASDVEAIVTRVRAATAPFRALDSAVAAGYPRDVPRCFVDEHHGAMGYHHVKRAIVDSVLDLDQPEILLYERAADSSYRLTAVEFIVPYRLWPADSDSVPTIHGQRLHRVDEVSVWGLHVWAWKENPAGLFADWNPTISCPPGTPYGLR